MAKKLNTASALIGSEAEEQESVRQEPEENKPEKRAADWDEYRDEFKTERTQILFRKSTKAALKKIAKKKTRGSLNELVNRICEEYINENAQ